jgi:ATP-dependent protease ClpP protease subunit
VAKLFTQRIGNWFTLHRAPNDLAGEIPDYEGGDYDAVMDIHGQIGKSWFGDEHDVDAATFMQTIDGMAGKKVLVSIHSPGGNVWDSFAIRASIARHGNADTRIEGIGASAASVIFQGGKTRIMPRISMQMMHKNSTYVDQFGGNAEDFKDYAKAIKDLAQRLEAHDETLAKMYSDRSGNSIEDCRNMMDLETWMDGDQCLAAGMCDKVVDCMPSVSNNAFDLTRFKRVPAPVLNQYSKNKTPILMDRTKMIALLNKWGVEVPKDSTDKWLEEKVSEGKPVVAQAVTTQAVSTTQVTQTTAASVDATSLALLNELKSERIKARKDKVERRIDNLILSDRLEANRRKEILDSIVDSAGVVINDSILDILEKMEPRAPGYAPVNSVEIETASVGDVAKGILKNRSALNACLQNRVDYSGSKHSQSPVLKDVSLGAIETSKMLRKYIANYTKGINEDTVGGQERRMERIGELCEHISNHPQEFAGISNDVQQGPYGSATVGSNLQRQVIFSEAMRAFRRKLAPLQSFAHTWNNVPLEGNDEVIVPYYPLFTTGSYRFVAPSGGAGSGASNTSPGYVFNGTDVVNDRIITVGGAGSGTKVAGMDRAYQAMTWSTYLLRRQPWVDIVKLCVMRVEQLAIDILNDIICAWILKAQFGNAVYSNSASFFQTNAVAQLAGVASKLFWPENNRTLVINTDFWVTLLQDPALKAFLNIGTTEIIREAKIGGLYKFSDTIENPIIPVTSDGNLAGWMSYPSAVLCATSPMMPAPGVAKLLMTYDVIIDDQIGLSFEYRHWGEMVADQDRQTVESSYGSGFGEGAALRRLVVTGS